MTTCSPRAAVLLSTIAMFGCASAPMTPSRAIEADPLVPGLLPADPDVVTSLAMLLAEARTGVARERSRRDFDGVTRAFIDALGRGAVGGQGLVSVGQLLDRAFDGQAPAGAYATLAQAATAQRAPFNAYLSARDRLIAALAKADLEAAWDELPLAVPPADPSGWFALESLALLGYVRDLSGDPSGAVEAFAEGEALARTTGWRRLEPRFALVAAEVAARAGGGPSAAAHLDRAMTAATDQLSVGLGLDPLFWERALLADDPTRWPASRVAGLAEAARLPFLSDTDGEVVPEQVAAIAGMAIADAYVDAGDGVRGLLAYRRAGQLAWTARGRDLAEVSEARALIALGRFPDARSVLMSRLEDLHECALAEALVHLGTIELAEERPARAAALLSRALELAAAPIEFPSRSQGTANYGLALLMTSHVDEGIQRLQEAQAAFAAEGNVEGELRALENELEAVRQLGIADAATRIEERIRSLR